MVEMFSVARVIFGLIIMSAAAMSDWKTRRVSYKAWIVMGITGMALLAMEMFQAEDVLLEPLYAPAHYLIFIPIVILFFDVFWDREPIFDNGVDPLPIVFYLLALAAVIALVMMEGTTREVLMLLTIPAMILVAELFYYTGLLHGGADAKALMSLAILFPFYPQIDGLPFIQLSGSPLIVENIQMIFPFAFLLLTNAAILQVITVPLAFLFKNLARRDTGFPEMFLGYRMDLDQVPKKFVWPMELVRDNEVVMVIFPKRGSDAKKELALLREKVIERIWVTPKIPFIIPMLLGLIFSIIVGNLMMLMF